MIKTTNVYPIWRGCLLLIRRSGSDKQNPYMWECPGGHVDVPCGDVDSLASRIEAIRELSEEVGIVAQPKDLYALPLSRYSPYHQPYVLYISTKTIPKVTLSHEHDRFMWHPVGTKLVVSPIRREVFSFIQKLKGGVK